MGICSCSEVCCTADACNCFIYDKNVQKLIVKRNIKRKWLWTFKHDLVLSLTLSDSSYNVPVAITSMIKDFTYCPNIDHFVDTPTLCQQLFYNNQKQLLTKPLCNSWYTSQISNVSTMLSIKLYSSNTLRSAEKRQIFKLFDNNHLPSLKPSYLSNDIDMDSMRTVCIDKCTFRIRLQLFNNGKKFKNDNLCFIMFKESDDMTDIDSMCNNMSHIIPAIRNCILVKITENKKKKYSENGSQISAKWKIPLVTLCPNDEQNFQDLFVLAIKYHWFLNVMH